MPRPSHFSRFYHQKSIWEYRLLSSSLCSFLHYPVTSSPLGPRILLSILFTNILILRNSFHVNDQFSYPYIQQAKFI
jgi:hypothetical protein